MKSKLFLGIAAVLALASCNPSTPAATTTEESKANTSATKSSEDASSQASSAAGTSQAGESGKDSEQYGSEGSQEEISTPAGEDSSAPVGDPYKLLKEFNFSLLSDHYDMVFLVDTSTTTLPLFAVNNFGKQGFRFTELDLQTEETSVTGIGAIGELGYFDYVVVYEDEENPEVGTVYLGDQFTKVPDVNIGDILLPGPKLAYMESDEDLEATWKKTNEEGVYKLDAEAAADELFQFLAYQVGYGILGSYSLATSFLNAFSNVRLSVEPSGDSGVISFGFAVPGSETIYSGAISFAAREETYVDPDFSAFIADPANFPTAPTGWDEDVLEEFQKIYKYVPLFPEDATVGLAYGFDEDEDGNTYFQWSDLGIYEDGLANYVEDLEEAGFEPLGETEDGQGNEYRLVINPVTGYTCYADVYFVPAEDSILNPTGYALVRYYFEYGEIVGASNINAYIDLLDEALQNDELNWAYIPHVNPEADGLVGATLSDRTDLINGYYHGEPYYFEDDVFTFYLDFTLTFEDEAGNPSLSAAGNYVSYFIDQLSTQYEDLEAEPDEDDPYLMHVSMKEGYYLADIQLEFEGPDEAGPLAARFDGSQDGSLVEPEGSEPEAEPVFTGNVYITLVKQVEQALDREAVNAKLAEKSARFDDIPLPAISEDADAFVLSYDDSLVSVINYGDKYGPSYSIYEQGSIRIFMTFANAEDLMSFIADYSADLLAAEYVLSDDEEEESLDVISEESLPEGSEEEVLQKFGMVALYNGGQVYFQCDFELEGDGTYSGYIYFAFANDALWALQAK